MLEIGINHHLVMNALYTMELKNLEKSQNVKISIFWYFDIIMKLKKDFQKISSQKVLELSKV
jgi:hypothetical protein